MESRARGRSLAGVLAGALLLPACASPPRPVHLPGGMRLEDDVVRIPLLDEEGNRYSVEVHLDGAGPFRFLLDPGAEVTVVDPVLAERFLAAGQGHPCRLRGALGGEAREVPRGAMAEIAFRPRGGPAARVRDVPFVAADAPRGLSGVAGLGLFRGCRVTLDLPARTLELEREDGGGPGRSSREEDRLPVATLVLGGVEVEAVVDTGFSGTVYLPPAIAAAVPGLGRPFGVVLLADLHGSRPAEEHRLRGELRVGDRSVRDPRVLVGEGGPLLGAAFLRSWRVVVDGRGRFAGLEAPRTAAGPGADVRP